MNPPKLARVLLAVAALNASSQAVSQQRLPSTAGEDAAPALPQGAICNDAAQRQLTEWRAGGEWYGESVDPLGVRSWRLPTVRPGAWVVYTLGPDLRVQLSRIDAREVRRISFDEACAPRQQAHSILAPPSPGAFDDEALVELMQRTRSGVIYAWSPHMPLSVDAFEHAAAAARDLGVVITAFLDPNADPAYARETASAAGWPADSLRQFRSVELTFRNTTLHAPSILIYAGGRIQGLAVPGYRDRAGYKGVIRSRLAKGSQ